MGKRPGEKSTGEVGMGWGQRLLGSKWMEGRKWSLDSEWGDLEWSKNTPEWSEYEKMRAIPKNNGRSKHFSECKCLIDIQTLSAKVSKNIKPNTCVKC